MGLINLDIREGIVLLGLNRPVGATRLKEAPDD